MMSLSLRYTIVSKFQSCEDICNELKSICNLRAKHELICRSFESWRRTMEQNSSQLEILSDTAISLRGRHKMLTNALALQPSNLFCGLSDPVILKRLQREISAIELQICIWMNELTEVKDDRFRLDYNHTLENMKLQAKMQQHITNIELAHVDIDFINNNHSKLWKKFLNDSDQTEKSDFINYESASTSNASINTSTIATIN